MTYDIPEHLKDRIREVTVINPENGMFIKRVNVNGQLHWHPDDYEEVCDGAGQRIWNVYLIEAEHPGLLEEIKENLKNAAPKLSPSP